MQTLSGAFNSYLTSRVSANSPSGSIIIPANTIFRGQVTYYNAVGTTYSVVRLADSNGATVAILGAQFKVDTGGVATFMAPIELPAGTYTWVTVNANSNDTHVSITGVCYKA